MMMLALAALPLSSCAWVQSHVVDPGQKAEPVRPASPSSPREKSETPAEEKPQGREETKEPEQAIQPTEAQQEAAIKLIEDAPESAASPAKNATAEKPTSIAEKSAAPGVPETYFSPSGGMRDLEPGRGATPAGQDARPQADPAEQRGLRSIGLPKTLPMDVDGKWHEI